VELTLPLPVMAAPLVRDKVFWGAVLLSGRASGGAFSREDRMLISFVADAASVAIGSFKDREAVEKSYVSTMSSLMETVEAKDSYTRGHTERVMEFALDLARASGVSGQTLQDIEWAAALHDIGKIALPDAILLKPGSLTTQERGVMQEHPIRAERILQHLKYLNAARMIVRSHHEAYDGSGYPDGLAREEIPLGARILAIADSYDAMTSVRPYRNAMSPLDAMAAIEANAGKQFDPRLAATFLKIMRSRIGSQPTPRTESSTLS
jgi:HD-GYP domain-containing protein (c-di-GMP phosphodiesterase class II)